MTHTHTHTQDERGGRTDNIELQIFFIMLATSKRSTKMQHLQCCIAFCPTEVAVGGEAGVSVSTVMDFLLHPLSLDP